MIRRCLFPALWCAVGLAQLPPPQAPPPKLEAPPKSRKGPAAREESAWRVDAVVTDASGRAIPDLTAADFEVQAAGKTQKIAAAEFHPGAPRQIALVADDLSLSVDHLAAVKTALRRFVDEQLPPGEEAAILRTSGAEGALDRFTADKTDLRAAIDRIGGHAPEQHSAVTFTAGSLSALRSVLLGLEFTPGRKMVAFFSQGLREPARSSQVTWTLRLLTAANNSSTVFYAIDLASAVGPVQALDQGLADVARDSGGGFLDAAGDPAKALAELLRREPGYYILDFHTEPYPHMSPLVVKTRRAAVQLRWRNGVMGTEGAADAAYIPPGGELRDAVLSFLTGSRIHLGLTPKIVAEPAPALESVLHIDARDITFVRGLDGIYHAELQAAVALFQENDSPVSQVTTGIAVNAREADYRHLLETGFDGSLRLPAPPRGPYQLRAAVIDANSGSLGSATCFFDAPAPPTTALAISAIQLQQTPPVFTYQYDVFHVRHNEKRHALIQVTNQLLRDGMVIYTSPAKTLDLEPVQNADRHPISGTIRLGAQVQPGRYTLRITVTDTLAPQNARRSVTGSVNFEVRP